MKGFPTSADIYLELDGRKIAVVQSYRAKAAKSSKNIEAFGESEPVATIEGQKSYTVELTRLYATDTAISDGIDFYNLTDFSLVICNCQGEAIYGDELEFLRDLTPGEMEDLLLRLAEGEALPEERGGTFDLQRFADMKGE